MSFLTNVETAPNGARASQLNFEELERRIEGYEHVQVSPAAVWTVTHNLGYRPAAVSVWISNNLRSCQVDHIDDDTLTASFNSSVSGILKCK